jgi:hypothetical protein
MRKNAHRKVVARAVRDAVDDFFASQRRESRRHA